MTYTVITDGICKSFDDQIVLDHVDLAVETGSVLALLLSSAVASRLFQRRTAA